MIIIDVNDLKVHIKTESGMLKAVDGVDLAIEQGQTLGLVGESGCGKSITAKAILGINPKNCVTTGELFFNSLTDNKKVNIAALSDDSAEIRNIRGAKISMIFQEPMTAFAPMYTVGQQISEMLLLHRTKSKAEARKISITLLTKVGIAEPEKRFDQYPHEFSGGMLQRAMIAMALSCNPELLIADEPTTALDVTIQAQVLELMSSLQKEFKMAILFITHDLGIVAEMCDKVAVMYLGRIVEIASTDEVFLNPKHPYTKALLKSIPKLGDAKKERLESIKGTVPQPIDLPPMCGFYERCENRIEGKCNQSHVPNFTVGKDHEVRCFLFEKQPQSKGGEGVE